MVDRYLRVSADLNAQRQVISSYTDRVYFVSVNVVPVIVQSFIQSGTEVVVGLIAQASQVNWGTLAATLAVLVAAYLASFLPSALELMKSTISSVRILRFIPANVINEVASIRNTMKSLAT